MALTKSLACRVWAALQRLVLELEKTVSRHYSKLEFKP